ncbi:MAG: hypothetical protein HY819_11130 [Acidobacteria bacterium]|nr:hypothetical protein [Acidobacteriota bacterium]
MQSEIWIAWSGFLGTLLLVFVGLLNYSVFIRQLRIAREQIQTAIKQVEIAQKQPELQLIQRSITETTEHVKVLVAKPYLRPYFYENKTWQPTDPVSYDEIKAMAELILNNFASALMHSASFPQYPGRGIEPTITFHLRNSPELQIFLFENFDRFPFTGLTLLCLKNQSLKETEEDLKRLISIVEFNEAEKQRRQLLLEIFKKPQNRTPLEFTKQSMSGNYLE